MNITQLKYFSAICEFTSVSAAANYLHISQPSLSRVIKELESEFGVTLFLRHKNGVALTQEGETLYNLAKDILNRANHAEDIMKDLGDKRKKLRLGVPPMIGSLILQSIYKDFSIENPDISLVITEGGRQELIQKLNEDYIDMIFLLQTKPLENHFQTIKLASLEIAYCTTRDNPISSENHVTPDMLSKAPIVLFKDSYFQTAEIKKWFENDNIKPNILMQTEQLSTMLNLISNNVASGFMFRSLIENNDVLVAIPLEKPMYADACLVWKNSLYSFNSMKKFKDYVKTNNPFNYI